MEVSKKLVWVLATCAGLATDAGPARAEEPEWQPEAALERLEARVEDQAREIETLRRELQRLRLTSPKPASATPPTALPPAAPAGSTSPVSAGRLDRSRVAPTEAWTDPYLDRVGSRPVHAAGGGGLRWGGYLTVEYVANSAKNSYFDLHRFVLQMDAPLGESIGLQGEIEIEHGGADDILEGEVKIEYLEVLFPLSDVFQPKVGALLVPFGRFNLYHDDPLNDFTMRPLTGRYLVPSGFGQPGVGAEGAFRAGRGALAYQVALTAGFDDGFSTANGVRGARQSWKADSNESKQVWGRLAYLVSTCALDQVEVGLSGTWGRYDEKDRQDLFGFAADFFLQTGPFQFQGEYIHYALDRPAGAPPEDPRRLWGLWLEAAYHFFPPLFRCGRTPLVTDTSHFTLALRYQALDLNDRLTGGAFHDDLQAWSVGLNYRIREASVFRVDWTWFDASREDDRQEFTASFSTYF